MDVPPWRRVPFSVWAWLKHVFGIHTYLETLHWADLVGFSAEDAHLQGAIHITRECWVCGRQP